MWHLAVTDRLGEQQWCLPWDPDPFLSMFYWAELLSHCTVFLTLLEKKNKVYRLIASIPYR